MAMAAWRSSTRERARSHRQLRRTSGRFSGSSRRPAGHSSTCRRPVRLPSSTSISGSRPQPGSCPVQRNFPMALDPQEGVGGGVSQPAQSGVARQEDGPSGPCGRSAATRTTYSSTPGAQRIYVELRRGIARLFQAPETITDSPSPDFDRRADQSVRAGAGSPVSRRPRRAVSSDASIQVFRPTP